jgi:2-oxoglutarate ferredoxin oxidoreductase subunit beta
VTDYDKYLRLDRFPLASRPGCGDGIVLKAILRAVDRIGLTGQEICLVSGNSSPSRALDYLDSNTHHAARGHAFPFATGVKIARPDMTVVVVEQDGDATGIWGKHLVHAARRNIDITLVLLSSRIHGTAGGIEPGIDFVALAAGAGASFVARETVAKPLALDRLIERALRKRGFSLVEVVTPCPATHERRGEAWNAAATVRALEERSVPRGRLVGLDDEARADAIVTGVFVDASKRDCTAD